jgi:adenylate cyclase
MGSRTRWRAGLRELSRPGEARVTDAELRRFTTLALSAVLIGANLIGAAVVLALLTLKLVPLPLLHVPGHPHMSRTGQIRLDNALVALAYVALTVPLGWVLGNRIIWSSAQWLRDSRVPEPDETRALLYGPARLFVMQLALWLGAALLFSLFNLHFSHTLAVRVAIVVSLTGFSTAACAYLTAERVLRSLTARALDQGMPDHLAVPGVTVRTLLAWGLGTVVPVGGLLAIGVLALTGDSTTDRHNLGVSTIALTSTGIVVGLLAVGLAVRTTADPISSVRRALARVQRGDFEVRVPVYDASEIGQLQLGFNDMVEGLAERERIRAAFGTYVDPDVAERIIRSGTNLGGEQVDVSCMFLDVRGFTRFAEATPPEQVVGALNRLFDLAVPIIHHQGGRIDKFVGDGLLAVFGAPRRLEDHADRALTAAEQIAAALVQPGRTMLEIGVGINSGPVVAGNVGGGGRFEFSVIGDTVNVAARVEAATRKTGDVILVSEHTRERLPESRRAGLVQREGIELKGKHDPVGVYALVTSASAD